MPDPIDRSEAKAAFDKQVANLLKAIEAVEDDERFKRWLSEQQAVAQLKAAAYQLAAILGAREAANKVERVAGEIRNMDWPDRQHGGS